MKNLPLLFLLIFLTGKNTAHAQAPEKNESQRLTSLLQKLEGTYQIQIIDSRELISLPPNYLDSIQIKRHPSETKYLRLTEHSRVMIAPSSAINKKGFAPLQRIVYLTTGNNN